MLKKIVLLKFFPIFLKTIFHGNENFNKKLFLLKNLIDLEKIYQNRANILMNERFFQNLFFIKIFCLKTLKFQQNNFFPTYLLNLEKI